MVVDNKIRIMAQSLSSMRFHSLWPSGSDDLNPTQRKMFFLKLFITYLFCCPAWILPGLHLWRATSGHVDGMEVSEDFAILSSLIGIHYVNVLIALKQERLVSLFKKLSDFKEFGRPPTFDSKNKQLNLISKLYFYYCTSGVFTYWSLQVLHYPTCTKNKNEGGYYEICGMLYQGWLPYNADNFPWQQILSVISALTILMVIRGGATISFTTFELAGHIIIRIDHLIDMLNTCFDDDDPAQHRKNLHTCIRYHQHIILTYEDFDSCYSNSMGVNVFMAAAIFGSLTNQFVEEKSLPPLIHLGGWIIALFVVCAAGQNLIDKTLEIADAAFNTKWYRADAKLQRDLKLMIMRAQKPLLLHARPLATLSFPLFAAIMKTSYSYLTLLNKKEE